MSHENKQQIGRENPQSRRNMFKTIQTSQCSQAYVNPNVSKNSMLKKESWVVHIVKLHPWRYRFNWQAGKPHDTPLSLILMQKSSQWDTEDLAPVKKKCEQDNSNQPIPSRTGQSMSKNLLPEPQWITTSINILKMTHAFFPQQHQVPPPNNNPKTASPLLTGTAFLPSNSKAVKMMACYEQIG